MMITNEPIEVEGAVKHRFGGFWTVIFLRKGSSAEKYIEMKEGIRYLDPVYLKDEPITMTRIGQSSRKLAELVFSECGIKPKVVQETGHISTLLKYAQEGFASAIGPCIREASVQDQESGCICRIPESYQWFRARTIIHMIPEVNRLVPKRMLRIIEETLVSSMIYE